MRDPEPCRIKHTEDTEQQTGCHLLFILHSSTKFLLDNSVADQTYLIVFPKET